MPPKINEIKGTLETLIMNGSNSWLDPYNDNVDTFRGLKRRFFWCFRYVKVIWKFMMHEIKIISMKTFENFQQNMKALL